MTRVLVTGGAGFIGGHLVRELVDHGYEVSSIDHHDNHAVNDISYVADILEPKAFSRALLATSPEVIIHLAAQVGREFGEDDVRHTVRQNAEMTTLIAHHATLLGARLMYASTSEVYGDQGDNVCYEDSPLELPHNLYGLSKRWGEEVCELYHGEPVLMRFSMPYGPGAPPGRGRRAMDNFIWQAQHGMPIRVHRGAERSWCWVGDTVRGIRMILESGEAGPFNIGRDDVPLSMLDLALEICYRVDAPLSLIEEVDPPSRQTVVKRLATDRLRGLGWSPTVEMDEGLDRMIEWISQFDENGEMVA